MPIASALPPNVEEAKFAALTASMMSLTERFVVEMGKGDLDYLVIKSSDGYIIKSQAGPNAFLSVSTTITARLGLILLDIRRTAEKIAMLI